MVIVDTHTIRSDQWLELIVHPTTSHKPTQVVLRLFVHYINTKRLIELFGSTDTAQTIQILLYMYVVYVCVSEFEFIQQHMLLLQSALASSTTDTNIYNDTYLLVIPTLGIDFWVHMNDTQQSVHGPATDTVQRESATIEHEQDNKQRIWTRNEPHVSAD